MLRVTGAGFAAANGVYLRQTSASDAPWQHDRADFVSALGCVMRYTATSPRAALLGW